MLNTFFGIKLDVSQTFDKKGSRHVVSHIKVNPLTITQIKSQDKDGYLSIQCAIANKSQKSLNKPLKNHLKGAKLTKAPLFLREIKFDDKMEFKSGDQIKAADIFKSGDKIKVTGISKGRGFAGVIKRWGFHGGPRTHGQSDRERAPGSIGQGTDPGRVWKGKKMPGHFGTDTKTIRNLQVITIDEAKNILTIAGTIPGARNSLVKITKIGTFKKPIKLFSEEKSKKEAKESKESKKPSAKKLSPKKSIK